MEISDLTLTATLHVEHCAFQRIPWQLLGGTFSPDTKRRLLHKVLSKMGREFQQLMKCRKQNWLRDAPNFRTYGKNCLFLLWLALNKVHEGSTYRCNYSLSHNTEHPEIAGSHFSYGITNEYKLQPQSYAPGVCFSQSWMEYMSSASPTAHVRSKFLINVPFTTQPGRTLRSTYLGHRKPKRKPRAWIS